VREWLLTHIASCLSVLPWVGQYLGRTPELITGRLPLRFLLGVPIGFIGGDRTVLLVCSALICYGLLFVCKRENGGVRVAWDRAASWVPILIWLLVPTLLLYLYSSIAHPIFGPARYTLFVGPAYLILVARGLGKLPWPLSIGAAATGALFSGVMLCHDVFRSDLKADLRGAAAYLDKHDPKGLVAVIAANPSGTTELETARYYLEPGRAVIPWREAAAAQARGQRTLWVLLGLKDGHAIGTLPPALARGDVVSEVVDFSGVRLVKIALSSSQAAETEHSRGTGAQSR
jgi:hypothetical protein